MPNMTVKLRKEYASDDPEVEFSAGSLQDITQAAAVLWGIPLAEVRLTHHGTTPTSLRKMQEHDVVCVHASKAEAIAFMELQPHRSGWLIFIDSAFDVGYVSDPDVVKVFGRPARLIADSWNVDDSPRDVPPVLEMLQDEWNFAGVRQGRPLPVGIVNYTIDMDGDGHPVAMHVEAIHWI